ncbi:MAG: HD domain-containing protein [Treponema sp.]|jgi:HD superfamily phosphodiesterase|nr:HD domain-containing protein [Treponema sp.]
MVDKIMDLAIKYNGNDVKRINHLLKVYSFAHYLGAMENCNSELQTIIDIAALLHDIGMHEAERKHHSNAGKWQEIEGPIVAQDLLNTINLDTNIQARVLYLISHHHTYKDIDGIDYQILIEADFLVNIFEDTMEKTAINNIKKNIFKTNNGIKLLEQLYGTGSW